MANIFISYSSVDRELANRLRDDLVEVGHHVWLDVYEIKVGDPITSTIQAGIDRAEFILVLLSKASVKSKWVEREWQARFNEELTTGRSIILPVRIDDCELPALLRDKSYADAATSYAVAFKRLCEVLGQISHVSMKSAGIVGQQPQSTRSNEVIRILSLLGDQNESLPRIIPQILPVANEFTDSALVEYCQVQLNGIGDREYSTDDLPIWAESRAIKTYVSIDGPLNPSYMGWNGNTAAIWQYIEHSDRFKWFRMIIPDPIHWIEGLAARAKPDTLWTGSVKASVLVKEPKNPDASYTTYMHWDAHKDVCTRIRQDLVRLLTPYA